MDSVLYKVLLDFFTKFYSTPDQVLTHAARAAASVAVRGTRKAKGSGQSKLEFIKLNRFSAKQVVIVS